MPWHAIHCRTGRELSARDKLVDMGVEVFAPYEREIKSQRNRVVSVDRVVWAPYIFAMIDGTGASDQYGNYCPIKHIPGVIGIVGIAGKPILIPDEVIDKLKTGANEKGLVIKDFTKPSFWFDAAVGDQFEFNETSFVGMIGRITSLDALDTEGKIGVAVSLFGSEREMMVSSSVVGDIQRLSNGRSLDRVGKCQKRYNYRRSSW